MISSDFVSLSPPRGRTSNLGASMKRVTHIATQLAFAVQTTYTHSGSNAGNGGKSDQASCFHVNVVSLS